MSGISLDRHRMSLAEKLSQVQWFFVLILCVLAAIGLVMLYSAAGGNFDPWASRQIVRFGFGLGLMIAVAVTDLRLWLKYAYVFYGFSLVLLVVVEITGLVGMGAQRWISLGFVTVQPSELMKVSLILALARYFNGISWEEVGRIRCLIAPVLMLAVPTILVVRQPDLGTAVMLSMVSAILFFLAGVRLWKFMVLGVSAIVAAPIGWQFLHVYQKKRILTFINPENDPLGAGYHIIQSKIALGSGGVFGKGYLLGSQSHLNFLPEKQTDFIFTMLAEEFGMIGGLTLICLYILVFIYGFAISLSCRNQFGRLVGMGVTATVFLYSFINIAMVMGLVPVVGVPLPLVSYGGTAMLTLMVSFGLLLSVHIHRDVPIGRRGGERDL